MNDNRKELNTTMTKKNVLGDRMKEFYENRAKTQLIRRMPVVVRL